MKFEDAPFSAGLNDRNLPVPAPAGPHPLVARSLGRMRAEGARHLLVLGCGSLSNLIFLAGNAFVITGITASRRAMRSARRALGERMMSAQLVMTDLGAQPFAGAVFDAAIATGTLLDAPRGRIRRVLEETARVLRPGGLLIGTLPANAHGSGANGAQEDGASSRTRENILAEETADDYAADRRLADGLALDPAGARGAVHAAADAAVVGFRMHEAAAMIAGFAVERMTLAANRDPSGRPRAYFEFVARRLSPA